MAVWPAPEPGPDRRWRQFLPGVRAGGFSQPLDSRGDGDSVRGPESPTRMKNFCFSVLLVLVVGAVSFGAFYLVNDAPELRRAARQGDAMAWLRVEFRLDEAQFAAIKQLHDDYAGVCERHCADIMRARRRKAPAAEIAALEEVCVGSMTEHFRHVARLMPAGEGDRYLAIVLPRVNDYTHEGAPTVQVRP